MNVRALLRAVSARNTVGVLNRLGGIRGLSTTAITFEQRKRNGSRNNFRNNEDKGKHGGQFRGQRGENRRHDSKKSKKGGHVGQYSEGDGLRGLDDYVVDKASYANLNWEELKSIPEDEARFSGVGTLQLAERKILSRVLVNSLYYNRHYTELTPAQARSMLPILQGNSMVVRAKTGTGKTAAFAIPIIQDVLQKKREGVNGPKALIISPTRELATQIAEEVRQITAYGEMRAIKTESMVGGLSKNDQIKRSLMGRDQADILVGTPGRILDIVSDPFLAKNFSGISMKVLDEADRLLDIGFKDQLLDIDTELKRHHAGKFQTLLFSATTDKRMMGFARNELDGNVKIEDTVPENEPQAQELVSQHSVVCHGWGEVYWASIGRVAEDFAKEDEQSFKAILFAPTIALTRHYSGVLDSILHTLEGVQTKDSYVYTVHGGLTQAKRQQQTNLFRQTNKGILVTTDVAARGMDFPGVTHVYQLGCPTEVSSYIHRIGRTARIGNRGQSVLFYIPQERPFLKGLEKINATMASNEVYKVVDHQHELNRSIGDRMVRSLSAAERDEAIKSLFGYYGSVAPSLRMNPANFNRDQKLFVTMFGYNDDDADNIVSRYGLQESRNLSRSRSGGQSRFKGSSRPRQNQRPNERSGSSRRSRFDFS